MRVKVAPTPKRAFLVYARRWKTAFCEACPRKKAAGTASRQARQGAAGGGWTKADTGDKGLSATCTYGNEEVQPFNLEASVGRVCDCSKAEVGVSPLGAKRPILTALGRFGRLGA